MATVLTVPTTHARRFERLDAEHYASPLQTAVSQMAHVPVEWVALPDLDSAARLRSGGTPSGHDLDVGEVPFITIECIDPLWLDMSRTGRVLEVHRAELLRRVWLKDGDVLITIKRRIANAAIVYADAQNSVVNQDVAVLRPNGRIPPEVIAACLLSRIGQDQARLLQTEQINPYISVTSLQRVRLPLLPESIERRVVDLVQQRVALQNSAEQYVAEAVGEVADAARIEQRAPRSSSIATMSSLRFLRRLDSEFYCGPQLTFEDDAKTHSLGSSKVSSHLTNGATPAASEYSTQGVPILKVGGLSRFSIADWLGDRVEATSSATRRGAGYLKKNDVLVLATAHDVKYIGKAALVHEIPEDESVRAVGELIVIRPSGINGATLSAYLNIPAVREAVQRLVRGQSAHLYPVDLRQLPVPEFSPRLQARVSELFDRCQDARKRSKVAGRLAIQEVEAVMGYR